MVWINEKIFLAILYVIFGQSWGAKPYKHISCVQSPTNMHVCGDLPVTHCSPPLSCEKKHACEKKHGCEKKKYNTILQLILLCNHNLKMCERIENLIILDFQQ